jgi:signal transduction histidine kinase
MTDGRHTRVLAVEDSPTQAEELRLILESGGFDVATAPDAGAALALLRESRFDVVVSDIVMPGLSGYDLCRRIKADASSRAIPVLLLTSLSDPIDVVRALESGADSFLGKPIEPTQLVTRVNSLLETRRLRAQAGGAPDVDVFFHGTRFTIASDKEQILDLLISSFDDMSRKNAELAAAHEALAAKHAELVRLEQQKEELSALVVHDLKSPASGIMMAAQIRLRQQDLTELERRMWRAVYTAGEVISRLVMNLLDIASSRDGVFAPRPEIIDVAKLVSDVRLLMTPVAEGLGHDIVVDVSDDLPPLRADPELLRRVLQNLVDNALRHSGVGIPVHVEADAVQDGVRFRVRDQGPGIPVEMREQIFDKYVRLGSGRESGTAPGKGLGLSFCRIAVQAHGGRIWVEDNQPQGSVFTVHIPR